MASILQLQRRAIEYVYVENLFTLREGQIYQLDGKAVYLIGVSRGVGTCSDLHGIDVAVFEKEKPPNDWKSRWLPPLPANCHGAVLLRKPSDMEIAQSEFANHPEPDILMAVEGLEVAHDEGYTVHFKTTGKVKLYIPL